MRRSAQKRLTGLVIFAGTAALVACGDARLKELSTGMSRDSVLAALGSSPPDSEKFIYDRNHYIVDSKLIEVFYYYPKSRMAFVDTVPGDELTPVVLLNGVVTGWGWKYWDSVAAVINVRPPEHTKQ